MTTERDDTTAPMPDASTIHERGLERARRIYVAYCEVITDSTTGALAAAFQAAADALHAEADAAAEARKRGHQSLTKDLRNTAGRIVGIAQDLMELSKMDEPTLTVEPSAPQGLMTPIPGARAHNCCDAGLVSWPGPCPWHNDDGTERTAPTEAEHYTPATDPVVEQADVAAYLRGVTDALPEVVTYDPAAEQATIDQEGTPMQPALAFADPEPYRPAGRPPFPDAEQHRGYDYAALMVPVPADRIPAHWSWSQLTTIEDCGVQYRGQRLDAIPQQPQWANVGGTTFHVVTERFDRGAWQAGGADLLPEVHPELLKQRWHDAFAAEIKRVSDETGIGMGEEGGNWRASNKGAEGYTWWLIEGERMLTRYIENRRRLDAAAREAGTLAEPLMLSVHADGWIGSDGVRTTGPQVPAIEYEYERKVAGPLGELAVKGVIDRAYRCADGTIMVKDLKTGRTMPDDAQLGEYAWALFELTGVLDIKGCFYDARKAIFTTPVDLLATHPHAEYAYRYHAAEATRRMGVFMPRRSPYCKGCSIRYACPVGGA
jgi:PD-(D/E)XK nuclease superfamily protein